jgi:hypothetical protein
MTAGKGSNIPSQSPSPLRNTVSITMPCPQKSPSVSGLPVSTGPHPSLCANPSNSRGMDTFLPINHQSIVSMYKKMALQGNVERQKPALHQKKKLRVRRKPSYKKKGAHSFQRSDLCREKAFVLKSSVQSQSPIQRAPPAPLQSKWSICPATNASTPSLPAVLKQPSLAVPRLQLVSCLASPFTPSNSTSHPYHPHSHRPAARHRPWGPRSDPSSRCQ